ncbi:MAG: hypothetical protein KDE31_38005, partial [Caldilineaceae bacterium]|nr:hypothetical protein [Caldilineaceae bacterium]
MKVVGGIYSEYCYYPEWHQIFGSGGRGAAALTRLGVSDVTLHSAVALNHMGAVQATLSPYGVNVEAIAAKSLIEFSYTHPLSEPAVSPSPLQVHSIPLVESDIVLAYGMIESSIRVKGRHVVYYPQGGDDIRPPKDVAIAERLALVANEAEIRTLTRKKDVVEGARDVINTGQAEVVIVMQGPFGSTVVLADNTYAVPPFVTHNVFKIGSGDVFSAAFAKFWVYQGLRAFEAAENASRCAALYCDTKSIDAIAGFASFKNVGREKRK